MKLITFGLKLAMLEHDPDNPRKDLGNVDELANSILNAGGLLNPLIVVPKEGTEEKYTVIAGNRRLKALNKLFSEGKWESERIIECKVGADLTDREIDTIRLMDNLQRSDLNAIEEAEAFERMRSVHGMQVSEIAKEIGMSVGYVSQRITLVRLTLKNRKLLLNGNISFAHARSLVRLEGEIQDYLSEVTIIQRLSTRQLDEMITTVLKWSEDESIYHTEKDLFKKPIAAIQMAVRYTPSWFFGLLWGDTTGFNTKVLSGLSLEYLLENHDVFLGNLLEEIYYMIDEFPIDANLKDELQESIVVYHQWVSGDLEPEENIDEEDYEDEYEDEENEESPEVAIQQEIPTHNEFTQNQSYDALKKEWKQSQNERECSHCGIVVSKWSIVNDEVLCDDCIESICHKCKRKPDPFTKYYQLDGKNTCEFCMPIQKLTELEQAVTKQAIQQEDINLPYEIHIDQHGQAYEQMYIPIESDYSLPVVKGVKWKHKLKAPKTKTEKFLKALQEGDLHPCSHRCLGCKFHNLEGESYSDRCRAKDEKSPSWVAFREISVHTFRPQMIDGKAAIFCSNYREHEQNIETFLREEVNENVYLNVLAILLSDRIYDLNRTLSQYNYHLNAASNMDKSKFVPLFIEFMLNLNPIDRNRVLHIIQVDVLAGWYEGHELPIVLSSGREVIVKRSHPTVINDEFFMKISKENEG